MWRPGFAERWKVWLVGEGMAVSGLVTCANIPPCIRRVSSIVPPYLACVLRWTVARWVMPNEKGKIQVGERLSPKTEFKPGHKGWRGRKDCHDAGWLVKKHWAEGLTVAEMARAIGVTATSIRYWMKKLGVERREG